MINKFELVEDLENAVLDTRIDILMYSLISKIPKCSISAFDSVVINGYNDRILGYLEQHQSELQHASNAIIDSIPIEDRKQVV